MKRILLVIALALTCGILFSWPFIYFQHHTQLSLLEVFEVKSKCEAAFYQHCNLVYYFAPDHPAKQIFVEPDKTPL